MKKILTILLIAFFLHIPVQEAQSITDMEIIVPIYFFADEDGNILSIIPISEDGFRVAQEAGAGVVHVNFTGHEYDDDTDLTYANARYYNQDIGRFLSIDQMYLDIGGKFDKYNKELNELLSNPQALNSYSYTLNNPLLYIDPNGLESTIFIRRGGPILGPWSSLSLSPKNQFGHVMVNIDDKYYGFAPTSRDPYSDVQNYNQDRFSETYDNNLFTKVQLNTTKEQEQKIVEYYTSFENKQKEGGENEYNWYSNNCTQKAQQALDYAGVLNSNRDYAKTPDGFLLNLKARSTIDNIKGFFNKNYNKIIGGFSKERIKDNK